MKDKEIIDIDLDLDSSLVIVCFLPPIFFILLWLNDPNGHPLTYSSMGSN